MKTTIASISLVAVLLTSSAYAEDRIKIAKGYDQSYKSPAIQVVATDDSVEITDVKINRGNCSLNGWVKGQLPMKLKFGESSNLIIACKEVLEVEFTFSDNTKMTFK